MSVRLLVCPLCSTFAAALARLAVAVSRFATVACICRSASLGGSRCRVGGRRRTLGRGSRLFGLLDAREEDADDVGFAISHFVALARGSVFVVVDVVLEVSSKPGRVGSVGVHEENHAHYKERMEVLVRADLNAVEEQWLAIHLSSSNC